MRFNGFVGDFHYIKKQFLQSRLTGQAEIKSHLEAEKEETSEEKKKGAS